MINYIELGKQLESKTEYMTKSQLFSHALTMLWHTRYGYGRENIIQSDCSGLVSAAFYLTGIDIRVTADTFYNEVFTDKDCSAYDDNRIKALFVYDVGSSLIVHVAPIIEHGVCLDAQVCAELMPYNKFFNIYNDRNHLVLSAAAGWYNIMKYSLNTRCVYGLDPELKRLRKV